MDEALQSTPIPVPKGLDREDVRQYIIESAMYGDAMFKFWTKYGRHPLSRDEIQEFLE